MTARMTPTGPAPSRRQLLKSAAVAAGGVLLDPFIARSANVGGDDVLKVGLIGCGGRGTGAAEQALNADKNVRLVAMGDAFGDRLKKSLTQLKSALPEKVDVAEERCFTGFDAYKGVIAASDVVLLC